jgi:DNA-binding response OmpR family regulator
VTEAPVVVIADDDADIRHLVGVAVHRAGATVGASVADGAAAWQAILDIGPDLAILDVAMPSMTGLQVCRSVRSDPCIASTRVLLLSAAVQPVAIEAGLAAGADLYCHKPFSPRSLATQIKDLLAAKVAG